MVDAIMQASKERADSNISRIRVEDVVYVLLLFSLLLLFIFIPSLSDIVCSKSTWMSI